ncbi:MAG: CDP-glycerol glycerophosphotransferase family protein [Anaerovoracaceae bacterium]
MRIIINIGIFIFNIIYKIFKLFPTHKKVTFISRQSNKPSNDIVMINKKISDLYPEYKNVLLCKTLEKNFHSIFSYFFHLFCQMYHIATSEIVILDSYCILISVLKHKKNLLIIQMWHSIGTMKKFGYSILDKPEGSSSKLAKSLKMHKNYDYILSSGNGYRSHLAEGFGYPVEKIITLPLPRIELLKNNEYADTIKKKILEIYPQLNKKKNILYVPTFRKANDEDFTKALSDLCNSINYNQYNLIIKPHPLTYTKDFCENNAIIDHYFSSFDMLFISDIVISDYSCIVYEAAVLKKPIYFYTYDYEMYMSSRETYMDYKKEIPGPMCSSAGDLIKTISNTSYDYNKLNNFLNKYVDINNEHETENIVNFIFENRKI